MKKSLKKKDNRKALLAEYMSNEHGMTPLNAAIKAGYSDEFAKRLQENAKIKAMFGYSYSDIAEQEGWTPRKSIRRMIEKAGHADGVLAAQKIISAQVIVKGSDPEAKATKANGRTTDFIEVPDEDLILKYENRLWEITGRNVKGDDINNTNNLKNFNLTINLATSKPDETFTVPIPEVETDD